MFATSPTDANASMLPLAMSAGACQRDHASYPIQAATANRKRAFTPAASTSSRRRPKVRDGVAGNRPALMAHQCNEDAGNVGEHVSGFREDRETEPEGPNQAALSGHVPQADSAGSHERTLDWLREVPMPVGCRGN